MSEGVTGENPAEVLERLLSALRPKGRVVTAFSGGIDSTLVATAARQALGRYHAPAVIGDSASLPRRELEQARQLARQLDIQLIEVQPNEQDDADYQRNDGRRCYFCKTHLYSTMRRVADEHGIEFIANGTNTDDLGDHRPGLVAANDAGVISPLLEAGMDKAAVRAVAEHLGLPNRDKPASACLSSRLPYGTPVTLERLEKVEQAEDLMHELGFSGFRVRHHEAVARIELPWKQVEQLIDPEMRRRVIEGFKSIGYQFVTLDLEGFRSGSGNVLLSVGGISMQTHDAAEETIE